VPPRPIRTVIVVDRRPSDVWTTYVYTEGEGVRPPRVTQVRLGPDSLPAGVSAAELPPVGDVAVIVKRQGDS
jgi:hypothetical protein